MHCELIDAARRRVRCKYCLREMSGGVARLKAHLAGISGDVKACEQVPSAVRKEMSKYVRGKKVDRQEERQRMEEIEEDLHIPVTHPYTSILHQRM